MASLITMYGFKQLDNEQNPPSMYQSLPPSFRQGAQDVYSDAITRGIDEAISAQDIWWAEYSLNLVDPSTIAPDLIDFYAAQPLSPWREIWNPDFDELSKRSLLANTYAIFRARYTPPVLNLLFQCFRIDAKIRYKSGWILGGPGIGTPLPASLGIGITDYEIVIPPYIKVGTIEWGIIQWCLRNFGLPCAVAFVVG